MVKQRIRGLKKNLAAALVTCSVFLVVGLMDFLGFFEFLEYKTYDFRVRLLATTSRPSDDIMIILLDQDSIDWAYQERGWSWPWPRKAFADIIDYMRIGAANSIAFDVIFSEPSVYGPEDDAAFVAASKEFGRVVQTVYFSTQWGKNIAWPGDLQTPLLKPEDFGDLILQFSLDPENSAGEPIGAQFPIAELRNAAGVIGNITGRPDSDGIIRRTRLFALFDGKAVPSLSTGAYLAGGGGTGVRYDKKNQMVFWDDYVIPVDKQGASLLRFRGALEQYHPYFADEILKSVEQYARGEDPLLYPEDFMGKYVFFGYYAPGLFDICSTPISSVYAGVGVHITMLDNMLQQDFIREIPLWTNYGIILGAVILMSLLVFFAGRITLTVGGGVVTIGILAGIGISAYSAGYWVPMVAPMTGALFAFLTGTLYNYATEGSQRRFIKSAFSQYLSPMVIEQLLANPELLSLGGERREISIFFSDVQGFTSISEKLDPTQLTELLNDYLSFMTDTILDSGGTIDKYEGDAIIAFWNAPLNHADHAARALRASMSCQQKLAERQDFFKEKFDCRLLTRIGLNTGFAVVGNMGSNKRFDYTMLGDSVNLAARLEGLNKQFGTYLMCTENTFEQAARAGTFFGRKLAQVAVVGKKEPVVVYEPMPEAVFAEKAEILRKFDEARDLFYTGGFAGALDRFEALIEVDKPAFFYAEQCRYYLEHPAEWKGFWQAMSK
ncbi:MAG: adenylate/guanylate cyclase domain-containing protein [Spirochaetaceae bacterium]|jgi:adenylate cyclase|nr:adenylate/guanylate cyclase domain-containing protein [Spirochaetaceae bacterium]